MKREDVINELNELIHDSPVRIPSEVMTGLKDALAYIEGLPVNPLDPVKPVPIEGGPIFWIEKDKICGYKCPVCHDYIAKYDKYCDCGRPLIWED